MTDRVAPVRAIHPLHVETGEGGEIAALSDVGGGVFALILIHDHGGDLDEMMPLLRFLSLNDIELIALDLPGHGLSSGSFEPDDAVRKVSLWLDQLRDQGRRFFIVVAVGKSARLAWQLSLRPDVAGLCLISPDAGAATLPENSRQLPLLAVVASGSPEYVREWEQIRSISRGKWLSVSTMTTHEELVSLDKSIQSQVAYHLAGFAREVFASCNSVSDRGQISAESRKSP